MKEEFLKIAEEFKNGEFSEKELPMKLLQLLDVERSDSFSCEKSINDFIFELLSISKDKRRLPFNIKTPNGLEVYPTIKMKFENYGSSLLGDKLEKMIVTY